MSTVGTESPTGLQIMELIRDGGMAPPPAALHLGLEIEDVHEGAITFAFTSDERFSNFTTTHGGVLAAVADFALSTAVWTCLGPGADVVTTNLSVTYVRPAPLGQRYWCTGRVVHQGRRLGHAEAEMTDDGGRVIMRATATLHVSGAGR